MDQRFLSLLISLTLPFSVFDAGFAADPPEQSRDLSKLLAGDFEQWHQASLEIRGERTHLISGLAEFVAEHSADKARWRHVHVAIQVLGEFRAVESAPVLAKNIAFPHVVDGVVGRLDRVGPITAGQNDPSQRYPAVGALIQIGEPCLDDVIAKAGATEIGIEQHACLAVLRRLDGPTARERLTQAIQATEQPEVRERLKAVVLQLDAPEPSAVSQEEILQRIRDLRPKPSIQDGK